MEQLRHNKKGASQVASLSDNLLKYPQVSSKLGLSKRQVIRLMQSGALEHVKVGKATRFPASAVQKFIDKRRIS